MSQKKVYKWREKMDRYRASVTRDKFIADLKKAGFSVKDTRNQGNNKLK